MKIVTEQQYTPEFWAARRGIPTASCASKVFTSQGKPSKSQTGYIAALIGQEYDLGYGQHDEFATKAMRMGHYMEPEARAFYSLERDCDVQQVGFITTDDGRFGCSPDGLVGENRGLELKNPQHATQVEYLLAGKVPAVYIPQVHWSLIVTGLEAWDFLSYAIGLPPLLIEVRPNEYTEAMRKEMERFYGKLQAARDRIHEMAAKESINPEPAESYF